MVRDQAFQVAQRHEVICNEGTQRLIDLSINWIAFYAVSAIFQPYNEGALTMAAH